MGGGNSYAVPPTLKSGGTRPPPPPPRPPPIDARGWDHSENTSHQRLEYLLEPPFSLDKDDDNLKLVKNRTCYTLRRHVGAFILNDDDFDYRPLNPRTRKDAKNWRDIGSMHSEEPDMSAHWMPPNDTCNVPWKKMTYRRLPFA